MNLFAKLTSLAVVLTGGSLLMLWQLFDGHVALAWLALIGTVGMAAGVIVLITRETRRVNRTPQ